MRLAINAIAVIWKLLPRKTNILKKIFLSSALDLLTLAVVAGYFFFSMAWFMILDVKSRHIRSSPYVPFFHSLCDDCFAEFSSGLLFKSQFHLSYGDLYYKERKTWREQLYFVSLHVYNHVCWLAAVSSEKKKHLTLINYNCFPFLQLQGVWNSQIESHHYCERSELRLHFELTTHLRKYALCHWLGGAI